MLKTETYVRNPIQVEAVQVTDENISEVAQWCDGEVVSENDNPTIFIKMDVKHPWNTRQTKAFVGDWVLSSKTGFKSYTDAAFKKNFSKPVVMEPTEPPQVSGTHKTVFRDASSGEFVTHDYAASHPDTTVSETVRQQEEFAAAQEVVENGRDAE